MSDAGVGDGAGNDRRTKVARVVQFLTFVAMLDLLALALATQFVPPDRLTLLITVGPMLLTSPVLAYWFVYVRGTAGETESV
ncbi:DUF7534 family protein [Halobaculum marinum]|uniref:Uncharacterized protein n=1 Tax=Halobaculum marinum TaxID=3031996 RepID=A0ABD5WZJ3_9EURY|nr:hypothetical protein [Halobaculum sp. DT55]